MKKLILILSILFIIFFSFYLYFTNLFNIEDEIININNYFVYGNHFNLMGDFNLENKGKYYLTLRNKNKDIDIEIILENDKFYLSDKINDGLYLDNIKKGKYYVFLKNIFKDQNKDIIKYYSLVNNTKYENILYYTLSKYNNIININFDNKYRTLSFDITSNKDKDIYDITIDPGHGGMDSGAVVENNKESYYTMLTSKKIKNNLEKNGIKVKLTHNDGELSNSELLDEYNTHGRAVIPNEVKSKYTFSIHYNRNSSKNIKGFEIYTPVGIDYSFSKDIANNLEKYTKLTYSNNKQFKMFDGIYSRNLSNYDVDNSLINYKNRNLKPYNVTTNSNYFYMIRETGGYMTGGYVDDSNPKKIGVNPYYNSNIGNESYLLELGYLSNNNDMLIIKNEIDNIAQAVSDAIINEINNKK